VASEYDVVVVGAGAAGLLAAACAAERGRRTLLLEKNRKPGAKILMSGGTRCNITQHTDARGIIAAFGRQGRFLHSALAALGPADLVTLLETEGVATKVEETGKVFPVSDKASDVLAALLRRLERNGCTLALAEPLTGLSRDGDGFQLVTPLRTVQAESVIVTTGGKSYPGCGTTGDGYAWLAELGHTIVPPRPALTPVTTDAPWVAELRGVTITDVAVRIVERQQSTEYPVPGTQCPVPSTPSSAILASARGSFLFTHFGLSGPVVLDVSRAITGHPEPKSLDLECDFLPATRAEQLDDELRRQCAADGKKQVAGIVARLIPRRLADSLLTALNLVERQGAQLSAPERRQIVAALKQTRIPVSGTRGFKKAEVTAGGVSLDEVDSSSMQSKLVPGLYLAGEILDLDGPIGGYNFQAAFSTAWLAGQNA
jgi:predicted flavoprotein YhiN